MTPDPLQAQVASSIVAVAILVFVAVAIFRFLLVQVLGPKGASHLSALLLRDLIVLPFRVLGVIVARVLGWLLRR